MLSVFFFIPGNTGTNNNGIDVSYKSILHTPSLNPILILLKHLSRLPLTLGARGARNVGLNVQSGKNLEMGT